MSRRSIRVTIGGALVLALATFSGTALAQGKPDPRPAKSAKPRPHKEQTPASQSGRTKQPPNEDAQKKHPRTNPPKHESSQRTEKRSQATPRTGRHARSQRDAKVTICHATGSRTNPYVRITISVNALRAHRRHQGGRDIIPAPKSGCPKKQLPPGCKTTSGCTQHRSQPKTGVTSGKGRGSKGASGNQRSKAKGKP